MEHRWGKRIQVEFPIRVTAHQFSVRHGRLLNLSMSGAYIEADCELRILSKIKVAIMATHWSKQEAKEIPAYVTRKYREGVGIEWCEFAPDEVAALLQTVTQRPRAFLHRSTQATPAVLGRLAGTLLKHGT